MKTSDIKLLGADDALIAQTAAEALQTVRQHTEALGQRYLGQQRGQDLSLPRRRAASMHRQSSEWRRYHGLPSQHRSKGRRCGFGDARRGHRTTVIMKGADFHVEASAGTSVMKDFSTSMKTWLRRRRCGSRQAACSAGRLVRRTQGYVSERDPRLQRFEGCPGLRPLLVFTWTGSIPACRYSGSEIPTLRPPRRFYP